MIQRKYKRCDRGDRRKTRSRRRERDGIEQRRCWRKCESEDDEKQILKQPEVEHRDENRHDLSRDPALETLFRSRARDRCLGSCWEGMLLAAACSRESVHCPEKMVNLGGMGGTILGGSFCHGL